MNILKNLIFQTIDNDFNIWESEVLLLSYFRLINLI